MLGKRSKYLSSSFLPPSALVDLIGDIKTEKAKGATDAQLASARDCRRKGQLMTDFVISENSMGFHAQQEMTRILGDAVNFRRLGQLSLHGGPPPSHNPPNIEKITSAPRQRRIPPNKQRRRKAGNNPPNCKNVSLGPAYRLIDVALSTRRNPT
jgi:hypothetical protein